ncbi:hypothetical protein [Spirosoma aerophilum]
MSGNKRSDCSPLTVDNNGLRAKDMDFSQELVTKFGDVFSLMKLFQPEIRRVLFNLYKNVFYTVKGKQNAAPADYQLTVTSALLRSTSK